MTFRVQKGEKCPHLNVVTIQRDAKDGSLSPFPPIVSRQCKHPNNQKGLNALSCNGIEPCPFIPEDEKIWFWA